MNLFRVMADLQTKNEIPLTKVTLLAIRPQSKSKFALTSNSYRKALTTPHQIYC